MYSFAEKIFLPLFKHISHLLIECVFRSTNLSILSSSRPSIHPTTHLAMCTQLYKYRCSFQYFIYFVVFVFQLLLFSLLQPLKASISMKFSFMQHSVVRGINCFATIKYTKFTLIYIEPVWPPPKLLPNQSAPSLLHFLIIFLQHLMHQRQINALSFLIVAQVLGSLLARLVTTLLVSCPSVYSLVLSFTGWSLLCLFISLLLGWLNGNLSSFKSVK